MNGKKALVVGATGMVGTRLVEHLAANAWPVLASRKRAPGSGGSKGRIGRTWKGF